jgi:hypothetical protein
VLVVVARITAFGDAQADGDRHRLRRSRELTSVFIWFPFVWKRLLQKDSPFSG